jgi:hypothetical protein
MRISRFCQENCGIVVAVTISPSGGQASPPVGVERLVELLGRIFYIGPALVALGLLLAIALRGSSGWGVGGGLCGVGVMVLVVVPLERRRLRRMSLRLAKVVHNHP